MAELYQTTMLNAQRGRDDERRAVSGELQKRRTERTMQRQFRRAVRHGDKAGAAQWSSILGDTALGKQLGGTEVAMGGKGGIEDSLSNRNAALDAVRMDRAEAIRLKGGTPNNTGTGDAQATEIDQRGNENVANKRSGASSVMLGGGGDEGAVGATGATTSDIGGDVAEKAKGTTTGTTPVVSASRLELFDEMNKSMGSNGLFDEKKEAELRQFAADSDVTDEEFEQGIKNIHQKRGIASAGRGINKESADAIEEQIPVSNKAAPAPQDSDMVKQAKAIRGALGGGQQAAAQADVATAREGIDQSLNQTPEALDEWTAKTSDIENDVNQIHAERADREQRAGWKKEAEASKEKNEQYARDHASIPEEDLDLTTAVARDLGGDMTAVGQWGKKVAGNVGGYLKKKLIDAPPRDINAEKLRAYEEHKRHDPENPRSVSANGWKDSAIGWNLLRKGGAQLMHWERAEKSLEKTLGKQYADQAKDIIEYRKKTEEMEEDLRNLNLLGN